jgi:hypothetical protein
MIEISLLQYLTGTGGSFALDFSSSSRGDSDTGPGRLPFQVISDAGALTRIVAARVASDAGSTVKPVFLVVSRDEYPLLENAAEPVTNARIDGLWQQAGRELSGAVRLEAQGKDPSFNLFLPLFLCTKTSQFFHPPCPRCGQALRLCRDDALLEASGLAPYSTSLKRYLACPSCQQAGKGGEFFARQPGDTGPACVKGPGELIAGLLRLDAAEAPCVCCPERPSCSRDGGTHAPVTAFAFYPFYLLVLDAASLNAADYLALASGARPAELEQALSAERQTARGSLLRSFTCRAGALTLFAGDEREFLEILFLKLSLMGEIARHVLADRGLQSFAGPVLSLARLWVQIPEVSSLLPALWGFRLALYDLDLPAPGALPLEGPDYPCRVLGALWFQALLKNRAQDLGAVHGAVGRILRARRLDVNDEVLDPGNAFWNPRPAPERWSGLWQRALALGGQLLLGKNPGDGFLDALRELRDDIRKDLFPGSAGPGRARGARAGEGAVDREIGLILQGIASRHAPAGRAGGARQAAPPAPQSGEAATDFDSTSALSPKAPPSAPAAPGLQDEPPDLDSTSVLSPKTMPTSPVAPQSRDAAPDLDATSVISPKAAPPAPAVPQSQDASPDLDSTSVLSPKTMPTSPVAPQPRDAAPDYDATAVLSRHTVPPDPEEYEKTVVLKAPGEQARAPEPAEEDFRTETVLIRHEQGPKPSAAPVDFDATAVSGKGPVEPPADLDATAAPGSLNARKAPEAKSPARESAPDELEETVIMGGPKPGAPAAPKVEPAEEAPDDLAETVIIKPKKG